MKYATYQSYKFSGTDWIGEIPSNWECRRLKDCGALLAGAGFPHEYQGLENEELPFYKVGDLSQSLDGRHMASGEHTISRKTAYTLRAKVIPPSAIVYAKIGAALLLNRRRITVKDCCIDNNMTAFIPNQRRVSTAWTHYWLSTLDFGEFTNPGAVPSLSEGYQATLPITLPPLDEQQTIARFLDAKTAQIDALVAQKRQLIDKLKEKRQALIARTVTRGLPPEAAKAAGLEPNPEMKDSGVDWLGEVPARWKVLPLRRLIKFVKTGGTPSGAEEQHFEECGFNWYSPSDFSDDIYLGPTNRALSAEGKAEVRVFPEKTVMLVGIGATIGKVGLALGTSSCNQQINAIGCGPKLDPVFATYYLKILRDFIVKCGKFTTMPIINQDETKNLFFTAPPLSEQSAIADYLDRETVEINRLMVLVDDAISRLIEYRQAIITSAVTGKIDVRGVT